MGDVRGYLALLGLEVQERDEWLLNFCVRRVSERICNACHVASVPEGLRMCFAGMVLAEYLAAKRYAGELKAAALSVEPLVKQLTEGDTSVVWAVDKAMSPDERLDALLALLKEREGQLVRFRKVAW